jgi:hypothetical protein
MAGFKTTEAGQAQAALSIKKASLTMIGIEPEAATASIQS